MGNTAAATPSSAPVTSAAMSSSLSEFKRTDSVLNSFDLTAVALTPGSRLYNAMLLNAQYCLSLDVDRLLYSFRVVSGVDTRGAQPYGGWESPSYTCHGHFVGHALMAYAWLSKTLVATQPDMAAACLVKSNAMVAGFAECQATLNSSPFGYFGSVGTDTFDRLERLADEDRQDAPYYLVHKNMAGLMAAHVYTGNAKALPAASALADYFVWRCDQLTQQRIDEITNTRRYTGQYTAFFMEHGGMLAGMVDLYRLTGKQSHLELAHKFDRDWFRKMLVSGEDRLAENGEHANADLQPVTGLACMYGVTQDEQYRTAVLNFLSWMQTGHEFITGNVSGKSAYPEPLDYGSELFNSPMLLDRQVNGTAGHPYHNCAESCCAHNLNKTTVYAVAWTRDARWGDEFECRFVNGVLPQQHPDTGMLIYNLNLQQGSRKMFGDRENTFWCCYASGIEAYASLTNGAFFHDDEAGLWVNNYLASTVSWPEQGLQLKLDTDFPDSGRVKLTLTLQQSKRLVLNLRIPSWAVDAVTLKVNGVDQQVPKAPGSFAAIDRQWSTGDVVQLELPFSLSAHCLPDKQQYAGVKYGPHALVACAAAGSTFGGTAAELLAALTPSSVAPCCFTATLQGPLSPKSVLFKPISVIGYESYNGYTIVTQPPAEVQLDSVDIGDAASEATHGLQSDNSNTGSDGNLTWRDATTNGFISYTLQVHATKQSYLKLLFDGDEAGTDYVSRVFDLQLLKADGSYRTFATQSLDQEAPNDWYSVVYPLPLALTSGQSSVRLRLQAKGFDTKPGTAGAFYDQIRTHYYDD